MSAAPRATVASSEISVAQAERRWRRRVLQPVHQCARGPAVEGHIEGGRARHRKGAAGRVYKLLRELADERPDDYETFWREFGVFLEQGVATSFSDQADLLPLLRFQSTQSHSEGRSPKSHSEGRSPKNLLTSLADYVARTIEGQTEIYYILGADPETDAASPHLDPFRARGLEVLTLADPFDGFMMQGVREFEGKKFRNVDDPGLELPGEVKAEEEPAAEVPAGDFAGVLARFKTTLGDRVTEVRESKVLVDSPARLVTPEAGFERDVQRVRRILEADYKIPPKILELNRRHPLIRNLAGLIARQPGAAVIEPAIALLFDNLLLVEGLHPNPAVMAPRTQALLKQATK